MKKSTYIILFCIATAILMICVNNSSLFGLIDCQCGGDDQLIQSCGAYCQLQNSFCIGWSLKSSSCIGTLCNSTFNIYCENDTKGIAGGAIECGDCSDPEGDGEPATDWHFPDFYE